MSKPRKKARQAKGPKQSTEPSVVNSADTNPSKVHSFSRTIAKDHGEKAAVILQYLAYHISKSKQIHDGRKWFYKTLDELAEVFPYLKRSTIHDTLRKLSQENGPLMTGDYNKEGYDRTNWVAFRDDNYRKQAQSSKPAFFRVNDAVKYGIVAAVLLGNLVHWIRENRKEDADYKWHPISLGELANHLPFSKPTMHRALADLVKAKVLTIKPTEVKGSVVQYAFVDETRITGAEEGGHLTRAVIHSKSGLPGKFVCGDQSWEFNTKAGKSYPLKLAQKVDSRSVR